MDKKIFWKKRNKIISVFFLIVVAIIFVFPFFWAIGISLLKEPRDVYSMKKLFKPPFEWRNWLVIFKEGDFLNYIKNTLIISVSSIIFAFISNSFVAYGFARFRTKGIETVFFLLLTTMFMPAVVMSIPQYILWTKVGATDTYIPFIFPQLFSTPIYVFILRQVYMGIPSSLAEAAYIDGMSDFGVWFKIYVPLAKPTLAFIMVQVFMATWNDFMGPLIYISTPSKYTLMQGLRFLSEKYRVEQNISMAASICSIIPVFIVYIFAQKHFVAGLAAGAVKQ